MFRWLLAATALLWGIVLCDCCSGAERAALLVGNAKYAGDAALRNPGQDADAIAKALKDLTFEVINKHDVNIRQFEDALTEFRNVLSLGGIGLVYFAGHGLEVNGVNYLVPIGAELREESHARRQCLDLVDILNVMRESSCGYKVVVLDCCRNNPFKRNWNTRGLAERGLTRIDDIPDGTMIVYSTSPGRTASDGRGDNSPFAKQLVSSLRERPSGGLELRELLLDTCVAVRRATMQTPWLHMDGGFDKYFLWTNPNGTKPQSASVPGVKVSLETLKGAGFKVPPRKLFVFLGDRAYLNYEAAHRAAYPASDVSDLASVIYHTSILIADVDSAISRINSASENQELLIYLEAFINDFKLRLDLWRDIRNQDLAQRSSLVRHERDLADWERRLDKLKTDRGLMTPRSK